MASPSYNQQIVVNEISWDFNNFFRGKDCCSLTAPLEVKLSSYALKFEEDPNDVQPDLLVIFDEKNVNEDNKYEGLPSLIVEVLTSSIRSKDMITKLNLYMKSAVVEYWIIDFDKRKITQYFFIEGRKLENIKEFTEKYKVEVNNFTDLKITLEDIFSEI